ncbi:hypothetical protein M758_5G039400 [Ceratodon purpureus]|nr:hypothetical protein M758_5G039400 [Ceratodon purpureus]
MKMTASSVAATTVAMAGSESPSRSFSLREKFGKLHLFSVDRTNRWPVQGWSSSDESHLELDEHFVAEESARAFTLDKETRWPLQGWCKAHKPYNSTEHESAVSSHLSAPSRWPQGW